MPQSNKMIFHVHQGNLYRQVGDETGVKFHQDGRAALRAAMPARPAAPKASGFAGFNFTPQTPPAATAPAQPSTTDADGIIHIGNRGRIILPNRSKAADPAKSAAAAPAPAAAGLNPYEIADKRAQLNKLAMIGGADLETKFAETLKDLSKEDIQKIMTTTTAEISPLAWAASSDNPKVLEAMVNVLKGIDPKILETALPRAVDNANAKGDGNAAKRLENTAAAAATAKSAAPVPTPARARVSFDLPKSNPPVIRRQNVPKSQSEQLSNKLASDRLEIKRLIVLAKEDKKNSRLELYKEDLETAFWGLKQCIRKLDTVYKKYWDQMSPDGRAKELRTMAALCDNIGTPESKAEADRIRQMMVAETLKQSSQ
jgi:hypothetical protein